MSSPNPNNSGRRDSLSWLGTGFLLLGMAGIGLCFTSVPGKIKRGILELTERNTPPQKIDQAALEKKIAAELEERHRKEVASLQAELTSLRAEKSSTQNLQETIAEPLRANQVLGKVTDIRKMRSEIPFKSEVQITRGGIASIEREDDQSYTSFYQLSFRLPQAAATMQQLEKSNKNLTKIIPGLPALMANAKVSPWFDEIYQEKVNRIRRDANSLNQVLTKHNLYDCETILHLRSASGRKVFLMQSEMDVVSDGSDGDRLPKMPESIVNSANYQPFTSYGWPKQSAVPNPMVVGWENRLRTARVELADGSTPAARKTWLRERIKMLETGIADLKNRSFLIAEYDPFIVIPVNVLRSKDEFAPDPGDYAVVIYGDQIYPSFVGDGGPTFKTGEASLRLAKQLNVRATPYQRPVSDLKVTYLVFPGSAEAKKSPPNYAVWREKCGQLLSEIGGLGPGYELHTWQDLLPKPIPPSPVTPPVETSPIVPSTAPANGVR